MDQELKAYHELIPVLHCVCHRCRHKWIPLKGIIEPATCPGCHSALWRTPSTRPRRVGKSASIPTIETKQEDQNVSEP